MKAFRIIVTGIITVFVVTLANRTGAKDTTANYAVYPYSDSTAKVIGETYIDGRVYLVVQTTRVNTHLRVKETNKKNRYELNLDK